MYKNIQLVAPFVADTQVSDRPVIVVWEVCHFTPSRETNAFVMMGI